jgi:type II secretory pathway predicted ATPase ExeA
LYRVDEALAEETRTTRCTCGGKWHRADYLRERWLTHLEATRRRPVLLIDEAQEMNASVLSELRLLSSARFDSQNLLSVLLAGDARLTEKLRLSR